MVLLVSPSVDSLLGSVHLPPPPFSHPRHLPTSVKCIFFFAFLTCISTSFELSSFVYFLTYHLLGHIWLHELPSYPCIFLTFPSLLAFLHISVSLLPHFLLVFSFQMRIFSLYLHNSPPHVCSILVFQLLSLHARSLHHSVPSATLLSFRLPPP